ncbi:hypothetical protein Tco_0984892 [Tanacetum coccineum]
MSDLKFVDTHNLVAFLEKPTESEGFEEIVDFLNANPIKYALTVNPTIYCSCVKQFLQIFLNKQIERVPSHKRKFIAPVHTKKVFANMRRKGKEFSGKVTPLFETMLIQPQAEVGEGSGHPTEPQHTSTTASPSQIEPITIPSSSQPQKTHRPRKAKRPTKISQSSGPIPLVIDETLLRSGKTEWKGLPLLLLA